MAKQYGYQYETSPRKIEPEYTRTKNPYKKAKTSKNNKNSNRKKVATKKKTKYNNKPIIYIAIGFIMLFTISYRNSLINESYNNKEALKSQLSAVQKENEQLKVNIESSLNLNSVERTAKEELGMQKLNNNQKVYVNLQKKDYIEPNTEEVVIEKDLSFWDKIIDSLTEIIK